MSDVQMDEILGRGRTDAYAYCRRCDATRPVRYGEMVPHENGRVESADLFCTGCHRVIARLYQPVRGFG